MREHSKGLTQFWHEPSNKDGRLCAIKLMKITQYPSLIRLQTNWLTDDCWLESNTRRNWINILQCAIQLHSRMADISSRLQFIAFSLWLSFIKRSLRLNGMALDWFYLPLQTNPLCCILLPLRIRHTLRLLWVKSLVVWFRFLLNLSFFPFLQYLHSKGRRAGGRKRSEVI